MTDHNEASATSATLATRVFDLIGASWMSQAICTAAELRIPELIAGGIQSIDELPGAPSLQSLGVEGFDARSQPSWYGLLAPAGTPAEAIARIQAESVRALRDEKAAAALRAARIFVVASTTESSRR